MISDKIFSKVKAAYIFNVFALALLIISLFLKLLYEETKKDIVTVNHKANIEYVSSLSKNLSDDIKHILQKDFFHSLNDSLIEKEYVESNLKLFITTKYKYIYLVGKQESSSSGFIYLADGTKDLSLKKSFNHAYIPLQKEKFIEVYKTKKAVYFKNSVNDDSWATYLSPIVVDNRVEAVLVIKFSLQEKNTILIALEKLGDMFELVFGFFIIIFIFIIWFSYTDNKREEQKNRAYRDLQKSNTNLHSKTLELKLESQKVSQLNDSLEARVKVEVSKNRAKDAQLIHQARLAQMGEMISMIAHQWRQPLLSISAKSASMRIKAELGKIDDEFVIESTDRIAEYSEHLSDTIDDFRDFFKPNRDKLDTNYNDILASVSSIIETSILNKQIEIVKELKCDDSFHSYPNEIKQVILNLIKNAEDALLENKIIHPYIKIITYKQDNSFILEISDNAGGIDDDIIDKIFDPYFSTKLEKDGTGLGLYMSKIIIQEHCQGKLDVSNVNNGAKFKITLQGQGNE